MRILVAHNHYRQHGGEDAVVKTECDLLKKFGEEVHFYERSNKEIYRYSSYKKVAYLSQIAFSRTSYRDMRKVLKEFRPRVAHFHMTPTRA